MLRIKQHVKKMHFAIYGQSDYHSLLRYTCFLKQVKAVDSERRKAQVAMHSLELPD